MGVAPENRTQFVNGFVSLMAQYPGLAGFDMEYVPLLFLKLVFDPFIIIVGSIRAKTWIHVTRFPSTIRIIIFFSCKI